MKRCPNVKQDLIDGILSLMDKILRGEDFDGHPAYIFNKKECAEAIANLLKSKENFEHLKTGNIYQKIGKAINCTNGENDGQILVLYERNDDTFAREENEFNEKFKEV